MQKLDPHKKFLIIWYDICYLNIKFAKKNHSYQHICQIYYHKLRNTTEKRKHLMTTCSNGNENMLNVEMLNICMISINCF